MKRVFTMRLTPELPAKAEAQAAQLGLDRAAYVRGLIEQDLKGGPGNVPRQFASEDLVGAFRLGGQHATNRRIRKILQKRILSARESHR